MKKRKIILPIILITLLESCTLNDIESVIKKYIPILDESSNESSILSESESEQVSIKESESTKEIESIKESESVKESESINESDSDEGPINADRYIDIYSLNDFHGAVNKTYSEPGLERIFNYLNEKGKEDNTLIVNSGDMFQGSIESNSNYGNLIMDVMNYVHMDAMTLGNHEFDWGMNYIKANISRKGKDGYQTPVITSNLYNYNMATKEELDYANIGPTYSISTLENGLKVGFIGVIGSHQITSITSQFVDDYSFSNPTPIIKEISDDLRVNKDVDVIILLDHDGQSSITGSSTNYDKSGITLKSSVSNKKYVDAVICGHTHKNEKAMINGVPFIQTSGYGKQLGKLSFKVTSSNSISCMEYSTITPNYNSYDGIDKTLSEMINSYTDKSNELSNQELATLNGEMYSSSTLPNLVCKAMYDYASYQDFDVDYAITNYARYSLYDGTITYGDLFRCLPFDNQVYILDVLGSDIINSAKSNFIYRANKDSIVATNHYTIACIDYLAFHRDDNRDYDYFKSNTIIDVLKDNNNDMNYRDIVTWYLKLNNSIDSDNYSDSLDCYNTSLIKQSI